MLDLLRQEERRLDHEYTESTHVLKKAAAEIKQFEQFCRELTNLEFEFIPGVYAAPHGATMTIKLNKEQSERVSEFLIVLANLGCDTIQQGRLADGSDLCWMEIKNSEAPDFTLYFHNPRITTAFRQPEAVHGCHVAG